jgi:hypothetical protein
MWLCYGVLLQQEALQACRAYVLSVTAHICRATSCSYRQLGYAYTVHILQQHIINLTLEHVY